MTEYMQARVQVKNFIIFTLIKLTERVGTMSLPESESTMQINLICLTEMFKISR